VNINNVKVRLRFKWAIIRCVACPVFKTYKYINYQNVQKKRKKIFFMKTRQTGVQTYPFHEKRRGLVINNNKDQDLLKGQCKIVQI
jgi:hypothetical protein